MHGLDTDIPTILQYHVFIRGNLAHLILRILCLQVQNFEPFACLCALARDSRMKALNAGLWHSRLVFELLLNNSCDRDPHPLQRIMVAFQV